uniref:NADH-ubiquinone oxidoreductase chain 2 n=1 Tax=Eliomys quercinus TaxID=53277 RepID=A0A8A3WKT2_ELIQU|nr:NADH dehydrogenase subunit 2 [Eliomys quercinus]QTA72859.1 NADH dehydrogenase subunit 2 [Eliomys quercinus]
MNPFTASAILITLFSGTMIVLFSMHWLSTWIGLEMSMLAIIPIIINKASPRSTEAATKYFLVQATASMILMMAIILNMLLTGQWTMINFSNFYPATLATIALAMKLGLSPFHFWVPEVIQGTSLLSGMTILTWQKIAPMFIMYQIHPFINSNLLLSMALLSIALGGWGGLNQTQLRKIMAYSSIAHMGWMMAIMPFNPTAMLLNLIIYIMLTITMFIILYHNNNTTTLNLSMTWSTTPLMISAALITLMSLGGLPPLTGFTPKWVIIQELIKNKVTILATIMAMLALLNLYFYTRLIYSTSLTLFPSTNNMKMKWKFESTKLTTLMSPMLLLSTLTLPVMPIMSILN